MTDRKVISLHGAKRSMAKASRSAKAPKDRDGNGLPTIRLTPGELERTVDAAELALIAAGRNVFQRANMIVAIGSAPAITADRKKIVAPQIIEVGEHRLMELVMASANFEKWDARVSAFVPANAPMTVVKALQQRTGRFRLPPLSGIVNAPTMRDDGNLIVQPGYDVETGLLFDPAGTTFPKIPERPSRKAAEKALAILLDLISSFPFVSDADRSVALSAILTACIRRSLRTAPLHAYSAPVAGSGKSKLVDIANVIATGREAGVIALGKTDEETEKRLASLLMSGSAIAIDNAETGIGGDLLCQILTQGSVRMRVLGRSETPEMPTNVFCTATGNNVTLIGDMTRRAVLCRLDPKVERPELRQFAFEPVERAKAERGRLVAATLTVLRAFFVAGKPQQRPRLGSFEDWSDVVRGALVWLEQADPVETVEQSRAYDPRLESLRAVMMQWGALIGPEPVSASEAAQRASEKKSAGFDGSKSVFLYSEFREALLVVGGSGGFIDAGKLGTWLGRNKGRVIEEMRFEPEPPHRGVVRWRLHNPLGRTSPTVTPGDHQETFDDVHL